MALTAQNRGSIVGVKLLLFTGLKATIKTGADAFIINFWLYTP
jgi:hypothetical protein